MQQGWMTPGYIATDSIGIIKYLADHPPAEGIGVEVVNGYAVPGIPNAHSHAFQYAMAGLAEKHLPGVADDFWTWRRAMYDCALAVEPDHVEAIAAMLFSEMLRLGYTHVAEFHYLHHDVNGRPYNNLVELGERIVAAANTAGIHLTLIPVFYQRGGFMNEAEAHQRRFISRNIDEYFKIVDATMSMVSRHTGVRAGFGAHSLRAVAPVDIFKTLEHGPKNLPFHLHVSEQLKEVNDCVSALGKRPVEWLLENLPVNERFHLVHCTHLNDFEVKHLAQSRANVVLCPGTEGNLGDGVFRLSEFAANYGTWSIGTDSHISLNPMEDIRWLDYSQRLYTHRRNTFSDGATVMMNKIIPSGRRAMGFSANNFFERGHTFDAVVYKSDQPLFFAGRKENILSSIVYTSDASAIFGTITAGRWIVKNQIHIRSAEIRKSYAKAIVDLYP